MDPKQIPQWLGRPIVDDSHVAQLETAAALHEFQNGLARPDAEAKAHEDYVKEQRQKSAAHHLQGMRMAESAGDKENAFKHYVLFDQHMKALGLDSVGPVPPEINRHLEADDHKSPYRFKPHRADLYSVQEGKKEEQPVQKSEVRGLRKDEPNHSAYGWWIQPDGGVINIGEDDGVYGYPHHDSAAPEIKDWALDQPKYADTDFYDVNARDLAHELGFIRAVRGHGFQMPEKPVTDAQRLTLGYLWNHFEGGNIDSNHEQTGKRISTPILIGANPSRTLDEVHAAMTEPVKPHNYVYRPDETRGYDKRCDICGGDSWNKLHAKIAPHAPVKGESYDDPNCQICGDRIKHGKHVGGIYDKSEVELELEQIRKGDLIQFPGNPNPTHRYRANAEVTPIGTDANTVWDAPGQKEHNRLVDPKAAARAGAGSVPEAKEPKLVASAGPGGKNVYDYTHMLSPEHQQAGYSLVIHHSPGLHDDHMNSQLLHQGQVVGKAWAYPSSFFNGQPAEGLPVEQVAPVQLALRTMSDAIKNHQNWIKYGVQKSEVELELEQIRKGDVIPFPTQKKPEGHVKKLRARAKVLPMAPKLDAKKQQQRQQVDDMLEGAFSTMAQDPGMQAAAKAREVKEKEQILKRGPQKFRPGDRVSIHPDSTKGREGSIPKDWVGTVTKYHKQYGTEWDDDGSEGPHHVYEVTWRTPRGDTHEDYIVQKDLAKLHT